MNRRSTLVFLGLALSACASQHNTREVLPRVDNSFFLREQCKPTRTASLSPKQVTGLDELPSSLRHRLLESLPLQAVGDTERAKCQDLAARLLEDRLRALCWMEARVTRQGDAGTGTPAAPPRLSVQLGTRYQVGTIIWVSENKDPKVSPARVIEEANRALPKDKACTVRTLEDIWARVARLGDFGQVLVVPGPADPQQKTVTLVVDIKQKEPAPGNAGTPPGTQNPPSPPPPQR
ncbi:MAG TPA: hypothetical protein VF794_32935 [Archangium sp.]|jgi:translocation and assembly module TamA|uniref:hypothetical protein n=1 Tax=Archangium sp. TaxID=1872627 RepID=UPI002ED947F3